MKDVGRMFFTHVRQLHAHHVEIILIHSIQANSLGLAIQDRLIKAAHQ